MSFDARPRKPVRTAVKSFALPKVQVLQGVGLPKITAGTLFLGLIVVYAVVCLQAALRM